MDTEPNQLHFVLFPFMAQGHMIPMIDIARLLARRGVIITIFTTPLNAARFKSTLDRAIHSGLQIRLIQLQFPCVEAGLPERCENTDMMPSLDLFVNFLTVAGMLQEPAEKLFGQLQPQPNCIISDVCLPYTSDIAVKFNIPRIAFHGGSCFSMACFKNIYSFKVLESVVSESEYFVLPGLPDEIEFTKSHINFMTLKSKEFQKKMFLARQATYGDIINSYEELEPAYIKEFKKTKHDKFWCVGPVSLANKDYLDKAQRGNNSSVDEHQCLEWLDSQDPGSVVYACFGSVCNLISSQLMELGLGLEASNKPFILVIKDGETSKELHKWVTEVGFEERIKGRGLVIWGWAPQVLILTHPAVGGFLTHCGWNSILEGISEAVPFLTWPLFEDQFMNEKLVVQILRVGVRVAVEEPMKWGEEQKIGVLVQRENVKKALERLMDEGKDREQRRERARELGKMAKEAVIEGGSSHLNITLLLEDIMEQVNSKRQSNT
ncbi:Glycosyltransferase [Melia azedarach]|uniref:Glycosyltransferase n=1 Tax=Melia azedarach TaxID=155640 RepID=A0ACC1XG55_MELAZ|nr:Glycosyltransferase [Melia azedarach]